MESHPLPSFDLRIGALLSSCHAMCFSILAGFSTFLGMLATAFASSEVFRIFFKMIFSIVVLGLLHGLLFLPVYLSCE